MTNVYKIELNESVNATNNSDATTGVSGTRWSDNNTLTTVLSDGRTLAANDKLVYDGTLIESETETSISKIISLTIKPNSISNTNNTAIKIPLSSLEFSEHNKIYGSSVIGYSSDANGMKDWHSIQESKTLGASSNNLSADFIRTDTKGDFLNLFITKNYFTQIIREANVTLNVIIYYR